MMLMFGNDIRTPSDLSRIELIDLISYFSTSERLQEQVEEIRAEQDKEKRKALKFGLPYFVSGLFRERRANEDFIESELFVIDIDHAPNIESILSRLVDSPYVHFSFRSPSGDGVKVGIRTTVPIKSAAEYSIAYRDCALKFSKHFGVETDKTSDAARACYFSWDDRLYFNPRSTRWTPKTTVEVKRQKRYEPKIESGDETIERCVQLARTATVTEYADWIECGISLRIAFGDAGFDLFKALSLGKGFDDSEEKIWQKWRSFPTVGTVTIGTFIHLAKKYGGIYEKA